MCSTRAGATPVCHTVWMCWRPPWRMLASANADAAVTSNGFLAEKRSPGLAMGVRFHGVRMHTQWEGPPPYRRLRLEQARERQDGAVGDHRVAAQRAVGGQIPERERGLLLKQLKGWGRARRPWVWHGERASPPHCSLRGICTGLPLESSWISSGAAASDFWQTSLAPAARSECRPSPAFARMLSAASNADETEQEGTYCSCTRGLASAGRRWRFAGTSVHARHVQLAICVSKPPPRRTFFAAAVGHAVPQWRPSPCPRARSCGRRAMAPPAPHAASPGRLPSPPRSCPTSPRPPPWPSREHAMQRSSARGDPDTHLQGGADGLDVFLAQVHRTGMRCKQRTRRHCLRRGRMGRSVGTSNDVVRCWPSPWRRMRLAVTRRSRCSRRLASVSLATRWCTALGRTECACMSRGAVRGLLPSVRCGDAILQDQRTRSESA